jgi:hypothetical protein
MADGRPHWIPQGAALRAVCERLRRRGDRSFMPVCCPLSCWRGAMEPSFSGSGRHSSAVQLFLIALQPALAASASHARFMVSATAMAAATPALGQEANNKGTKLAMSMRLRTSSCGHGTLGICFGCCISNPGLHQAARRTLPSPTSPLTVRMSHCRPSTAAVAPAWCGPTKATSCMAQPISPAAASLGSNPLLQEQLPA